MCGCKQGTCPGGCPCGCRHTAPVVTELPEVTTADNPDVAACTLGGVDHDYRPHTGTQHNRPHTWLRCVWCHAVSCGDHDEPDPCIEPYHHRGDHRTRSGITWPKGGNRP